MGSVGAERLRLLPEDMVEGVLLNEGLEGVAGSFA